MNTRGEKIVAIVIARGGSKSIPRKNVLPLHGKPLVAWQIDLAKSIEAIDRVIVSTDDMEIADIARKYGAEVPFMRPPELAQDETPTLPVLQHCVDFLERNDGFLPDIVLLLYPTSPFLRRERVEEALALFETTNCNSVVSVSEDFGHYWLMDQGRARRLYPLKPVNRQYAVPAYKENGAIYFNRRSVLMELGELVDERSCAMLVMPAAEIIDIDEPSDWREAEKKGDEV